MKLGFLWCEGTEGRRICEGVERVGYVRGRREKEDMRGSGERGRICEGVEREEGYMRGWRKGCEGVEKRM